jgi:enoyl-CoA hydratase/carnithine racemase
MTQARYDCAENVMSITLAGPQRKNALTFELYAELRDRFRALSDDRSVKAVILTGAGGDFCSGGDVGEIIGPLTQGDPQGLLEFTQMTGDLVKAMRACPQPIVAAVDGACAGAGAILAMASDLRFGTERSRVAFLFVRVGLAGCDMGACAMLPRIIGLGRASELLYTGRAMSGTQAFEWGFYNELCPPEGLLAHAWEFARKIARGPTLAHAMTKRMLKHEWALALDEAIDAEAQAQAACMESNDFRRAYEAFMAKRAPQFEGN